MSVSEKNTKSQILSAYQELFKKYQGLASEKKTAKQQVVEENNKELINSIENTRLESVSGAAENYVKAAQELEQKISAGYTKYGEITAAIELKQAELAELFGIEKEAYNVVALKEAQKAESEAFHEIMKEKKQTLAAEVVAANETVTKMVEDTKKEQKRMEEEFDYSFTRKKQTQLDLLQDHISAEEKKMKEMENELKKQKLVVCEEEAKLAKAKEDLEKEKDDLIAKGKRDAAIEINVLKRNFENDKKLLEAEFKAEKSNKDYAIELLQAKVSDLQVSNAALSDKLELAYTKLQELARETVQSKGKDDLIKELGAIAKTTHNK